MRILWINCIFLDTALYSTFPVQIVKKLRKIGHEVHLIIASPTYETSTFPRSLVSCDSDDTEFLRTLRLPLLSVPSFCLMLLLKLPTAIKKHKPGIVIFNISDLPGIIPALLLREVRLIMDIRSSFSHTGGLRAYIKKIHYHISVIAAKHLCDGITVTSSALKEELCRTYRLDPARVGVLTNGVTLEIFDYEANLVASRKLRDTYKASNRFVVLYEGSIGERRGLLETLHAMAELAPRHPDILFFILGAGPAQIMQQLRSYVAEKHLYNNVCIHGPVPHHEVPKFIQMCDVGIVPMTGDSFPRTSCPLKLLEYLAMRRPAICTDVPFTREILSDGPCLVVTPSNEPHVISSAIEYAYENRALLEHMGDLGRAIIERHYTWERKAKDLEDFIRSISR